MDKYLYAVFTTHKQPEGEVAGPLVVDAGYITSNFNISEQKLRPLNPTTQLSVSDWAGFNGRSFCSDMLKLLVI